MAKPGSNSGILLIRGVIHRYPKMWTAITANLQDASRMLHKTPNLWFAFCYPGGFLSREAINRRRNA